MESLTCLMHGEVSLNGEKCNTFGTGWKARLLWLLQIWGFYICKLSSVWKSAKETGLWRHLNQFLKRLHSEPHLQLNKTLPAFSLLPSYLFKSLFLYLNILLLLFLSPLSPVWTGWDGHDWIITRNLLYSMECYHSQLTVGHCAEVVMDRLHMWNEYLEVQMYKLMKSNVAMISISELRSINFTSKTIRSHTI